MSMTRILWTVGVSQRNYHTRTHARTHTRTHERTHARTHTHTHAHTHTHTHTPAPGEVPDVGQRAVHGEPGVAAGGQRSGVLRGKPSPELVRVVAGQLVTGETEEENVVGDVALQFHWEMSALYVSRTLIVSVMLHGNILCNNVSTS